MSDTMIAIIDYGTGNLKSVQNTARILGRKVLVTDSKDIIKKAKKIIFPGVGHFGRAIYELKKRQIFNILKERIKEGIPFLGICLGMQVLFEESEESPDVKGFGVIEGKARKFKAKGLIVPHMGWNQITLKSTVPTLPTASPRGEQAGRQAQSMELFRGIRDGSFFYFVHSYYCEPKEEQIILTTTNYGIEFASSIHKENIWAVQFHAEKSQKLGLKLFDNFLKLC